KESLSAKLDRRMITGERMMITHVYLKKGCLVPKHAHMNEQITYVLEGALRFRLGADGEQQVDVRTGEVLMIPGNLPHSAEALEGRARAAGAVDALACTAEQSDAASLEALVREVTQRLGEVDVLVVNGGGPKAGTYTQVERADWDAAYAGTLQSALRLVDAV